jgi:hypothetical protein
MVELIAIMLGVGLLWAWLSGHWFARVLMTLVLIPLLGGLGAVLMALLPDAQAPVMWFGAALGAVAAWLVAGLPSYPQRKLAADVARHLAPPPGGWRTYGAD